VRYFLLCPDTKQTATDLWAKRSPAVQSQLLYFWRRKERSFATEKIPLVATT
jgi:hypothetical protein